MSGRHTAVRLAAAESAVALALAIFANAACTSLEVVPEDVPAPLPPATPEAFAAHVPTFEIDADPAAFAEMLARYDEDVEIDATVTMRRGGREVLAARAAELQVRGNGSAHFAMKSLGVKLDDEYDNADADLMSVPEVLPGQSLRRLRNFRLRNGGNDFPFTLLKDLGYARMVAAADLRVLPYYGEPAAAFVNGAFYGLVNLRTEGNANAVSRLTGIRKRDLLLAEVNSREGAAEPQAFEVKRGDTAVFRALERAIREGRRAEAMALVDEASLIDFVLVHTLFGIGDWPWNNVKAYGERGGRLRFMAFDFDLAAERHLGRGLLYHIRERRPNYLSTLFELALGDPDFERRFWRRRDELIDGGRLSPERLRDNYRALAATYEPVIGYQIGQYGYPASRAAWYTRLERYVEQYAARYRAVERSPRE